jgi:DNA repair exonuclease SbcCD ATPase subunit
MPRKRRPTGTPGATRDRPAAGVDTAPDRVCEQNGHVDLDSVAQELYGAALDDFVATRNGRAKEARAAGDRELAAEIQALAKPTTAAWLVNQLSREHTDDLAPLLDLGRELRDASAKLDGETMRRLGRQRNDLVNQLLVQARRLGAARSNKVSDDVAEDVRRTLEASFSDAEVADEVSTGQLTRAVEYAGFGEVAGLGGPTGVVGENRSTGRKAAKQSSQPSKRTSKKAAKTAASAPSKPTDLGARRRQRAEREVAEAAQRLEAAQTARDEAAQETERTTAEVERTEGEVERLRADLSAAEREAKSARQADRSAQHRLTRAERELAGLERVHDRAKDRLADLDG